MGRVDVLVLLLVVVCLVTPTLTASVRRHLGDKHSHGSGHSHHKVGHAHKNITRFSLEEHPPLTNVEDSSPLAHLSIGDDVLPWIVGFAHNGDFAHEGYWPDFWWTSKINFHSELILMDYANGGKGPDGLLTSATHRDTFILSQRRNIESVKYTTAFLPLSLSAWFAFEYGLLFYGESAYTVTKGHLVKAFQSIGLGRHMPLSELLSFQPITFFPPAITNAVTGRWELDDGNDDGNDDEYDRIARAYSFFRLTIDVWDPDSTYEEVRDYYNKEGKTMKFGQLLDDQDDKVTFDETDFLLWFGHDYVDIMGDLLHIPEWARGYVNGNKPGGSRGFVKMFHFAPDTPGGHAEVRGTNEDKWWLEYYQQTKFQDMHLKATTVAANAGTVRGEFQGSQLLNDINDTPALNNIRNMVLQYHKSMPVQIKINGADTILDRYAPLSETQLLTKKYPSTMVKSFPRVFEPIARIVIEFESPVVGGHGDDRNNKVLEDNMQYEFDYATTPPEKYCLAEDKDEFVFASHSDPRLRFLVKFLVSPDGIMREHHEFFYHDLYHAMIFGRTLGYQMDMAGQDHSAFSDYAWVGYAAGLFHDTGYAILNLALAKPLTTFRSNIPRIIDTNMVAVGKFGNMHELASLAYMMEGMWYHQSYNNGMEGPSISLEDRVVAAFAILASKIGSTSHLSSDEVTFMLDGASRQQFSDELVLMTEVPLEQAIKGGDRQAKLKAHHVYIQLRKLAAYALSLVYSDKYFSLKHDEQPKMESVKGPIEITQLVQDMERWQPEAKTFSFAFGEEFKG